MKEHTACLGREKTIYTTDTQGILIAQPCEACEENRLEYEARIAKEKAEQEAKKKRQSVLDAASLRALAALVEITGVPLDRDWNGRAVGGKIEDEIHKRVG